MDELDLIPLLGRRARRVVGLLVAERADSISAQLEGSLAPILHPADTHHDAKKRR